MREAIEDMTTPEQRTQFGEIAKAICDGSVERYRENFDPQLWADSVQSFAKAKAYCPSKPAPMTIVGYHFATSATQQTGTVNNERYVYAAEDAGKWTIVLFDTQGEYPMGKIVAWNVNSSPTKPAEIANMERWESAVPYLRWIAPLFVLGMITFVVSFYLRARRREREAAEER